MMVAKGEREVVKYDPKKDARAKYPNWKIAVTYLAGIPEIICPRRRIVLIDRGEHSREMAYARAVAHLDLGHHLVTGEFTREQTEQAEWLAALRLDDGTRMGEVA